MQSGSVQTAKVSILLSTYNGEAYVAQLLESLLAQQYEHCRIYIRDDGSTDNTLSILQSYQQQHPNIILEAGTNVGAVASFLTLLQKANDVDYFAFCDQDDIWLPDKISRAVAVLSELPEPANSVYFSNLALVDAALQPLGMTEPPRLAGFANALVENVITGATAVFGSNIRSLFLQAQPSQMIWHDWWLYLLASSMGHLCFDNRPLLQSRRHGQNQTAMRDTATESIRHKFTVLKRVLKRKRRVDVFAQAHYFQQTYENQLSAANRKLLGEMVRLHVDFSLMNRIIFLFNRRLRMGRGGDNFGLKLLTLLGVKV